MSSRVGPLVLMITSFAVRVAGDQASADLLALAALGTVTVALNRTATLQSAAAAARSIQSFERAHRRETA